MSKTIKIVRELHAHEVVEVTIPDNVDDRYAFQFVEAAIAAGQPLTWAIDTTWASRGAKLAVHDEIPF